MFGFNKPNDQLEAQIAQTKKVNAELKGLIDSLSRSTAIIEFKPDGTILTANNNFLSAVGYSLNEITGQHHKIFCDSFYSTTQEYKDFWKTLNNGDFLTGQYERVKKSGERIWLEASYNPVFDENERLVKIVKFASDISERMENAQEQQSLIDAMKRSNAVIEFNTKGEILTANDNFLAATGYRIDEIIGKHHRIFCEDSLANSAEYKQFWNTLNDGQYVSGQFKRVDKHGNVLWLEASYNPIFNTRGELAKIVKFATDVTNRIQASQEARDVAYSTSLEADKAAQEGSSVVNQAIDIMTSLSGDITQASENLDALNKQSDQINNIVNTISSIAEQTNLLALNAAIEAARAGEQGRGFAVVADEVRGLAARTSSSTTEIAEVVKQNVNLSQLATTAMQASIEQVNSGVQLVEQLSSSISEINAGVGQIVEEMDRLNQSEK